MYQGPIVVCTFTIGFTIGICGSAVVWQTWTSNTNLRFVDVISPIFSCNLCICPLACGCFNEKDLVCKIPANTRLISSYAETLNDFVTLPLRVIFFLFVSIIVFRGATARGKVVD